MENKKLLILDIDETLIHATKEPPRLNWDFEIGPYKVFERPFLHQFLNSIKDYYKIAIWSSASDEYVEQIVDKIFPNNYPLEFVWGRSMCTQQFNHQLFEELGYADYNNHLYYVKILKKVKKKRIAKIEEILIVDDTPQKAKYNYGNAIYPLEYLGNTQDDELELLLQYLIKIKETTNFRTLEKRFWRKEIKEELKFR